MIYGGFTTNVDMKSGSPAMAALAMHGCGQVERHRVAYDQGRHSLWTGDLGLWSRTCKTEVRNLRYGRLP